MARFAAFVCALASCASASINPERCASRAACAAAAEALVSAAPVPAGKTLLQALTNAVLAARRDWGGAPIREPATAWCPTAAPFEWIPATAGNAGPGSAWASNWTDDGCFASVFATAGVNASGGWASITGVSPASSECATTYSAMSSYSWSPLIELTARAPTAKIEWRWAHGGDEAADAATLGLLLSQWPCGVAGTLLSLARTLPQLAPNGDTAAAAVADWLTAHRIYGPIKPFTPPSKAGPAALALGDHVRSGSYIAVSEWTFMASMEAYGTGFGGTSHSALAVRRNGTLYITESTFGWPGGDGVQAHTWAQWLEMSNSVQSSSVLQLAPALAASFDEDSFWAWYDTVAGAPYGYTNYAFSVLDEGDPLRSLPAPLDARAAGTALVIADDILGASDTYWFSPSYNVSIMGMFGTALNKRLNSSCATMACLVTAAAAASPSLSLMGAAALPENPGWVYDIPGGGGRPALVCSAFVAAGLQAGLGRALPPMWATEQVPRDNWVAALWDADGFNETSCTWGASVSDTGVRFCQFAGSRAQPMTGASSLPIYAHMNEHCGSQWPAYTRCSDGNATCEC